MEADYGDLASDLRSEWGADAGLNFRFAEAAAQKMEREWPELIETVTRLGAANDPLIVELLAVAGRQWAEVPGDPDSVVRLFPTGDHGQETTTMESTMTGTVQAKIDELEDEIDAAQARNDTTKAQLLFEKQQNLYRRLPGGDEPVVGSGGRNL